MQFKPTAEALEAARRNGTANLLNDFAGRRSSVASNIHDGAGKRAGKHLVAKARKACGIGAGIQLFTIV